jgi:hypothetical protein
LLLTVYPKSGSWMIARLGRIVGFYEDVTENRDLGQSPCG